MWLLEQTTRIIRRPGLHPLGHDHVSQHKDWWRLLYSQGLLKTDMVVASWPGMGDGERATLLALMREQRMIVLVDKTVHVVPSLLPFEPAHPPPEMEQQPGVVRVACFYGSSLCDGDIAMAARLRERCSLPVGLFEQLLAALLKVSCASGAASASGGGSSSVCLSRTLARVMIGSCTVGLELDSDTRTIKVSLYVGKAEAILQQLVLVMNGLVARSFIALQYDLVSSLAPPRRRPCRCTHPSRFQTHASPRCLRARRSWWSGTTTCLFACKR